MEFTREVLTAEMVDPATGDLIRTPVEVRVDPLTGTQLANRAGPRVDAAERLRPGGVRPGEPAPLSVLPGADQRAHAEAAARDQHGRDGSLQGEAVLFPNLHAYSSHSSVSIYSPRLHYLPLGQITERLMADNLATQVAYANAVMAADPDSRWASINANHMLPVGQLALSSAPPGDRRLRARRRCSGCSRTCRAARFDAYLEAERQRGERHLGNTGRVEWLVSFAPIAPAELRAFIAGVSSPADLDDDLDRRAGPRSACCALSRTQRWGSRASTSPCTARRRARPATR